MWLLGRTSSLIALALAGPLLVGFQSPTPQGADGNEPPASRPVADTFDKLDAEYDEAYRAWRSLPYEDRGEFQFTDFLRRFRVLGDAGDGRSMLRVVSLQKYAKDPGFDRAKVVQANIDRLLELHHGEDWLRSLAMNHMLDATLEPKQREANLKRWLELGEHKDAATMVRFCLAMVMAESGDEEKRAEALEVFDSLAKEYPGDRWAEQGKGEAFKLRYLQVGMVAPDFDTKDVDGVDFSLSDYRGKVVLLTFWGFW